MIAPYKLDKTGRACACVALYSLQLTFVTLTANYVNVQNTKKIMLFCTMQLCLDRWKLKLNSPTCSNRAPYFSFSFLLSFKSTFILYKKSIILREWCLTMSVCVFHLLKLLDAVQEYFMLGVNIKSWWQSKDCFNKRMATETAFQFKRLLVS
jgi:hypothetical protein